MSRTHRRRRSTTNTRRPNATYAQREPRTETTRSRRVDRLAQVSAIHGWAIALAALVVAVALQLGVLDWSAADRLTNAEGSSQRIPNTFASIDHPFHISKEQAVLDAIRQGDFPRWFSNHQAGYPAEFYPLGADLVVVAAWGLGLGLVPLEVVHKLVVIAVLFIPVAAYWVIARRDGWPASVAVTAAVLHLFLPGSWLGGGPDELLRMGMWSNVIAMYLMLPLMLWAADYLRRGSQVGLVLAAGAASLAIYTNPRATIAVATVLLAVGLVAFADRHRERATTWATASTQQGTLSPLIRRSLLLSLIIALITATLVVPLRVHQSLYEFTRFVEFSSFAKVWEYFSGAVPIEVMVVATAGAIVAARTNRFHSRVLALWLPLAALVSVVAGGLLRDVPLLAQFEGPRLLPLVRLPALFLAALAVHAVSRAAVRRWRPNVAERWVGIAAVAVVAVFLLTPVSTLSSNERGLPAIETTDQPSYAAIARSADMYDALSTPFDRPLIIGSPLSEHASFWIPALTDSNAFHAAWVWHWQTPNHADRTRIADLASALELDFLRRHALTMVLVATNDAESLNVARSRPHLEEVDPEATGGYAIFRVDDAGTSVRGPVSLDGGTIPALELAREHVLATIVAPQAAEVRIAINDYPAWKATVDGRDTPIRRSDDGYMLVDIPAGEVELELTYAVEPAVWLGRVLTTLGIILLVGVVAVPSIRRRPGSS